MTTTRRLPATLGAAMTLLLAACSGGPGATPTPAGAGASQPGGPGATATAGAPGATAGQGGPGATQGAGGGSGSPAPGVTGEACKVLTAADVEAILGATLVTTVPATQIGTFQNGCLFELKDGASGTTTSVNLGAMIGDGRTYWDTEIVPTMTQNGYTPIDGLGDAAVKARAGAVMAVAGDDLVYASYFGPAGPDQAVAVEVARRVLANLGH